MTTPIISATDVDIAQALSPAASTKSATASRATCVPGPEQRCRAISGDSVQCRREKVPNTDTPWEGTQSRFSRLMEQLCTQHKVKAQSLLEAILSDWKLLSPPPWSFEQIPENVQVAKVAARLCESHDGKRNDLLTAIEEDEIAQSETEDAMYMQAAPVTGTAGLDNGTNNINTFKSWRHRPGLRLDSDKKWSSAVNDDINDHRDSGQVRDCRGLVFNTAMTIGQFLGPSGDMSNTGHLRVKGKQPLTQEELDTEKDVKRLTTELRKLVALDDAYTQALEKVAFT